MGNLGLGQKGTLNDKTLLLGSTEIQLKAWSFVLMLIILVIVRNPVCPKFNMELQCLHPIVALSNQNKLKVIFGGHDFKCPGASGGINAALLMSDVKYEIILCCCEQ